MADKALGQASLILSTDSKPLDKGLNDAGSKITAFVGNINSKFSVISTNPYVAMATAAIGVIGDYWSAFRDKAFEIFAQVGDQAKAAAKLGIGAQSFQELLAGSKVDAEALSDSLIHLQRNISELSIGNREASSSFAQLGLSAQDLDGQNIDDQFKKVAAAIHDLPTAADQARLAFQLFGRQGGELLPAIRQGMEAATARAKELGLVLSDDQVGAMRQVQKTWADTSRVIQGIWTQLAAAAAPLFLTIAETVNSVWNSIGPVFRKGAEVIGFAFKELRAGFQLAVEAVTPLVQTVMEAFGGLNITVLDVKDGIEDMAKAFVKSFIPAVTGIRVLSSATVDFAGIVLKTGAGFLDNFVKPFLDGLATVIGELQSLADKARDLPGIGDQAGKLADGLGGLSDKLRNAATNSSSMADKLRTTGNFLGGFADKISDLKFDDASIDDFFNKVRQKALATSKDVAKSMREAIDPALLQKAFDLNSKYGNPVDKLKTELGNLKDLLAKGLISKDVFGAAVDNLMSSIEKELNVKVPQEASAALAGSKDAANILYQAQFGGQGGSDPQARLQRIIESGNAYQRRVAENSDKMVAALNRPMSPEI